MCRQLLSVQGWKALKLNIIGVKHPVIQEPHWCIQSLQDFWISLNLSSRAFVSSKHFNTMFGVACGSLEGS